MQREKLLALVAAALSLAHALPATTLAPAVVASHAEEGEDGFCPVGALALVAVGAATTRVQEWTVAQLRGAGADSAKQNIVLDLDAHWCGHSRRFVPVFADMSNRLVMRDDVKLVHVDIDADPDFRQLLGVSGYPTVMLWKKGTSLWSPKPVVFSGKRSRVNLMSWVEYHAPSAENRLGVAAPVTNNALQLVPATISGSVDLEESESAAVCDPSKGATGEETVAPQLLAQHGAEASARPADASVGVGDNSVPHSVERGEGDVLEVTDATIGGLLERDNFLALYFFSSNCSFCSCLDSVWSGVAFNLVTAGNQADLAVGSVNGAAFPSLLHRFNVTRYPTFIVVSRDGARVLGQYSGPRKVFELSTWITDLIAADENEVVKHKFAKGEEGEFDDHNPVFPYQGTTAFPDDRVPRQFGEVLLPSPSPSPVCEFEDNELMTTLVGSACPDVAGVFCNNAGSVGAFTGSICPVSCQSCGVAAVDNDEGFHAIFHHTCARFGVEDCTCLGAYSSSLKWCQSTGDRVASRYMATLCPATCAQWKSDNMNKDFTIKSAVATLVGVQAEAAALQSAQDTLRNELKSSVAEQLVASPDVALWFARSTSSTN